MGAIARGGDHHLLQEGVDVRQHEIAKRRHRLQCPRKGWARHLDSGAWHLDQKPRRGDSGTEDGLKARASLTADGRHLDDAAVRVYGDDRDYTAVWEVDLVERAVRINEDLLTLALDIFEVGQEVLE